MSIALLYPAALVLLLLIPLLWWFTLSAAHLAAPRRERARPAPRSRALLYSRLMLRSAIILALVLALAGLRITRPVDQLTAVFLIDGSDSISPAQRQQALDYINATLETRRDNDQAAVIVFGENALVEWAPSALARLDALASTPLASRTNLAEAIQLGLALFPADTQKRLVLLSDGNENSGVAREAAQLAAARQIPLDVVPLRGIAGPDVFVTALVAPDTAREGQDIALQANLGSSFATTGRLQVFADGELIETLTVDIPAGNSSVPLTVAGGETGFNRYEVRLEAAGDTQPINNRAVAFTTVQGPPRVLLIAGDAERAVALERGLVAASARVDLVSPDQVPANAEQLQRYAAIFLVDVAARDLPRAVQAALPVYVRDQGGGLAMIGGRESFGAGGWRRSPVAEALPVELDRKDTQERPDVGLVLVIDRSGSMSGGAGRGLTLLDLAKEAVYQASLGLERNDQIGVVAFDTTAEWILPVQPLPELADIEQALSRVSADGGTNIRAGVQLAADALEGVDARVKHVLLLTDGIDNSTYGDLIAAMQSNGTTISVVSIGDEAYPVLEQIADLGGGRFYRVRTANDVPSIFLSETILVAGRDIIEEQFTPAVALPAPVVRGLGPLPPLFGYNVTESRSTARTILIGPENKPILAQWQYGLGRGVAWTSDLKAQWAREWVASDEFPRFVAGLLDLLLPPEQLTGLALDATTTGTQTTLDLTLRDSEGRPLGFNDAQIEARLLNPNDVGLPLAFAQIGVGRYRATATTDVAGVYLAQVSVLDGAGELLGTVSRGIAVTYSPEYRPERGVAVGDVSPLLGELAALTSGKEAPEPDTVFTPLQQPVGVVQDMAIPLLWLALLLLPLDIALRRLLVRQNDLHLARTHLRTRLRRPFGAPAPGHTKRGDSCPLANSPASGCGAAPSVPRAPTVPTAA
ncbi:MAG: VWA domain-containing protein, partial [Chloroflexaceae bacterium]|nr:VWA domain-containing protein [Chloroflexaceae bacterium]